MVDSAVLMVNKSVKNICFKQYPNWMWCQLQYSDTHSHVTATVLSANLYLKSKC